MYIQIYTYIYISLHVFTYICIYIHTRTHTSIHTYREREDLAGDGGLAGAVEGGKE